MTKTFEECKNLKPCPFCGSEANWINKLLGDGHYYIRCSNGECHVTIKADREDKAIAWWNQRTNEAASEKIKRAIELAREDEGGEDQFAYVYTEQEILELLNQNSHD